MVFHNYQRVKTECEMLQLKINNTPTEKGTDLIFLD